MSRQSLRNYFRQPLAVILVIAILGIFILISSFTNSSSQDENFKQIQDLRSRIEDLKRIKQSVGLELKQLERERHKILKEKAGLLGKNEKLLAQINNSKIVLRQIELDISANRKQRSDQSCDANRFTPILFNPLKSYNLGDYSIVNENYQNNLSVSDNNDKKHHVSLLDHSACPLAHNFGFSLFGSSNWEHEYLFKSHRDHSLHQSACFRINLISSMNDIEKNQLDGNNSILINLSANLTSEQFKILHMMYAIVISAYFPRNTLRDRVDIVIPSIIQHADNFNTLIGSLPPHTPLERKYFASYFGPGNGHYNSGLFKSESKVLATLEQTLQTIHRSSIEESLLFMYNCNQRSNRYCYDQRDINIGKSMFLIILPSDTYELNLEINEQIYYALQRGTIPVIVGRNEIRLPFDEVVDWRRATISIPKARLPEILFILKSLSPPDLYLLKYHGRRIFENYLATSKQVIDTIINVIRIERFGHPPPAIDSVSMPTYYPTDQLSFDRNCSTPTCREAKSDSIMGLLSPETLGPRENPFASPSYRRNFSLTLNSAYDLWNNPMFTPNYLFPSLPTDPIAPSEFKFFAPNQGYRPVADGQGGSGLEFSRSIGGDYPNEQFTVVLLTFERRALLTRTLERLKGMAFLNKIIVIWNSVNQKPSRDIIWPDVGVPLELIKVERNSLNNRFLPLDLIETDAIFSMDDDSPLRPDEIVFAFRVWRQSRDRIVGFPGRFHAWDSKQNAWLYNSNHSCELSMVLTGGAFFHKYYTYMYSYFMPESIRSIVDRFMNCEDIAMNFLVAHLSRKPPIKVTSRWTFHCANCVSSLSEDDSHFQERHECLNMFASIYGYMPLLNTQHRSDSILFKTRVPKDKQKCFKFV